MAYATALEFAEYSGLGLRVVDENVGTGDGAEDSYDLDNDNIVDGSYTLSYAASGSNDFTALTETTDYTLDKESGRILLTASGILALGNDILYATYWYLDSFNDAQITQLLTQAQAEIHLVTGKNWDTLADQTDYFKGWRRYDYPVTEGPYDVAYVQNDRVACKQYPIEDVYNVYMMYKPTTFNHIINVSSTSGTTDVTSNASSIVESPVTLFDASPLSGDQIYFGSLDRFFGLEVDLKTIGAGTPTITWQFYNGATWETFVPTENIADVADFKQSGRLQWKFLAGWEKTTIDGNEAFFVRAVYSTSSGTYSTVPEVSAFSTRDRANKILEPSDYNWETNGIVYLTDQQLLSGDLNIRVDYYLGAESVPEYIQELNILYASVNAYVQTSGGSYDAATSYSLGSKSITVGEQYVNIREVIDQYKKRISEILDAIGRRFNISVI